MANAIQKLVFDKVGIPQKQHLVDLAAFRHKLLASNVANATTSGYERRDVNFQTELSKALRTRSIRPKTTRPDHIVSDRSAGTPEVQRTAPTADESAVDIDQEMAGIATNTLTYEVGMRLLTKTFNGLHLAIRGEQ